MKNPARVVNDLGGLGHRLNGAGLVIGRHQGDDRPPAARLMLLELLGEDRQIGDAVARDRDDGRGLAIEPAARQHRRMLDRRHIAVPGGLAGLGGERQRIGLGAAAGENHIRRARADECGDLGSGILDGRAAGPALRMHRRGISLQRERSRHRIAHFGAQRGRRVIVEIGTLVHAVPKLAAERRRLTLARAPVARAMKRGLTYGPLQAPS